MSRRSSEGWMFPEITFIGCYLRGSLGAGLNFDNKSGEILALWELGGMFLLFLVSSGDTAQEIVNMSKVIELATSPLRFMGSPKPGEIFSCGRISFSKTYDTIWISLDVDSRHLFSFCLRGSYELIGMKERGRNFSRIWQAVGLRN